MVLKNPFRTKGLYEIYEINLINESNVLLRNKEVSHPNAGICPIFRLFQAHIIMEKSISRVTVAFQMARPS